MKTYLLPKQKLSSTDLLISAAGLGTVKFGRNQNMKYPSQYHLPDDRSILSLLDIASDHGINWLDTAPAYGYSEERLGKLKLNNDWIIATKVGEEFVNGQSFFDFSNKHTTYSIGRSLKRLKKDHLDIVFIHSDGNDLFVINQTDVVETLLREKEKGNIRAIGFSGKTLAGGQMALEFSDAIMMTYNIEYQEEASLIQQAKARNIATIIKKGFGSGHLLQKYHLDDLNQFLFKKPIHSVLIGTINPTHLVENCQSIIKAIHVNTI